ncbi:GNAT family N-acetyltransferase [Streptomyces sp. NPDC050560]|uniref:GNAT family N-acetyltransferase n=1 Tax=Streptomyces sp. NPDC050560 TaxID=3365630 RepID=UPI0037ADCC6F
MAEASRGDGAEDIEVVDRPDDPSGPRYELRVGGRTAGMLVYQAADGDRRVLLHTEVGEEFQGRGLSKPLIEGALEDIAARGGTLTNHCPAVGRYLDKHPEWERLVDPEHPGDRRRG